MSIPLGTIPQGRRIEWSEACREMKTHYLRKYEIPLEHYVSLPTPTLRYQRLAFAFFSCAVDRKPGSPPCYGRPTRTWAIAATGAKLMYFAWGVEEHMAPEANDLLIAAPEQPDDSVDAVLQRLKAFEPIMDQAAAAFFEGKEARHGPELCEEFARVAGRLVIPYYRSIAPDFFAWLERTSASNRSAEE